MVLTVDVEMARAPAFILEREGAKGGRSEIQKCYGEDEDIFIVSI